MWNHWVVVGRLPLCISDPKNWQLWRFVICPSCLFTSFNTCSILERSTPLPPLLETKTRADRFIIYDTDINNLFLSGCLCVLLSLCLCSLWFKCTSKSTCVEMSHSLTHSHISTWIQDLPLHFCVDPLPEHMARLVFWLYMYVYCNTSKVQIMWRVRVSD